MSRPSVGENHVANWRRYAEELEAENKALREQFSRDMDFANKSYGDLKAENKALREALSELVDLMEDTITGDYKPDSFTCQPAKAALTKEEL